MSKALDLAGTAFRQQEVPVGAVVVREGTLLAGAFNRKEQTQSPLGHAELQVLELAAEKLKSWRLEDCELYVTLEPCLMCFGAILEARISHLIYGCRDKKNKGFLSHGISLPKHLKITEGVKAKECSQLLTDFFKGLRNRS